ncbi:protein YgfX [Pseudoalteromonas tunicata]|uniref:Uncharacterized protein n=1 Tax=Pseudoalteromonas tunicata D2 TaxID=87626 RepID=A4C6N8_9GAMM|nr:protein YgfX [Pseudoalteromonas tunicata]ATC95616.1 hypothetical protein PTUN_a3251 [Pseudoalteromonas tunicata]AXT31185.1 hypothetical protein D1819_10445 [Pseudoalteromonas tunicata]EAR29642.1 hypothetical protein PTD2_12519 [Pseudoalteromonas tunicata D2]MDP5212539.1 hypothetical protein [Pseudoalteromonas tunicata]
MYRIAFSANNQLPTFIVGFFIVLGSLFLLLATSFFHAIFLLCSIGFAFYFSWLQLIKSTPKQGALLLLENGDIELLTEQSSLHFQMLKSSFSTDTVVFLHLKSQQKRWLIIFRSSVNAADYARLRRHLNLQN